MLDISTPQKRERVLVIITGIVLCVAVATILPAQWKSIDELKKKRNEIQEQIEDHERLVRNQDEIRNQLTAFEHQSLAAERTASGDQSLSDYQNWLLTLATSTGLRNIVSRAPGTAGRIAGPTGYTKHTLIITAEGRLEQSAEFLRQFERSEYLHAIQSVQYQPIQNQSGQFRITFRIEVLSLPQVRLVNTPGSERFSETAEENQMLAMIRDRSILSEYRPQPPIRPEGPSSPPIPPTPPFDHVPYHFVNGIAQEDATRYTWINNRTMGRSYKLAEGEFFMLGNLQCFVRVIDIENDRIQIEVGEGLYTIRVGKNFDEYEDFQTITQNQAD